MVGNAVGMRTGGDVDEEGARLAETLPAGLRAFQMNFCLDNLFDQINELEDRYYNLRRPLGPDCVLKKGCRQIQEGWERKIVEKRRSNIQAVFGRHMMLRLIQGLPSY